jgi:hypothetical protein
MNSESGCGCAVAVGLISSLIAIFTFATGISSLPGLFKQFENFEFPAPPLPGTPFFPAPTPTRGTSPPNTPSGQFHILEPSDGATLQCSANFAWLDPSGLTPGHAYEIVVWDSGSNWTTSRGMTKADQRTSRHIDLDYLDDQREWFAPGEYEWGVLDITPDPYVRHSLLGYGGHFTFLRDGSCQ